MKLTPEIIRAEFIDKNGTCEEVSKKLSISIDKLEAFCFELYKSQPDVFELKYFLTKSWFEEKLSRFDSLVELANHTGIHYRTICHFKQKFLPEKRRNLSKEISRDTLWDLYIQQELSDKAIADMYGTNTANIKYLRQAYDIMATDRKPLEEKLPIELFHRLYVVSKLGLGQIASLFNSSRTTVTELRNRYAESSDPLASEIAATNNMGYYPRFLEDLLQLISKEDLCKELRTKTIFEVAAQYKLIASTANSLIPLSKEWFKAEMLTKNLATIAKENNLSLARVSTLVSELGLEVPTRSERISEELLRELFINRCWRETKIAKHLGVSAATVKKLRLKYKVLSDRRPSIEERISPELFRFLYIEEKMNLFQIATAFEVAPPKIRELRQKYIAKGYTEFAHRSTFKIQPERLEFLYKQIHLNLLKK